MSITQVHLHFCFSAESRCRHVGLGILRALASPNQDWPYVRDWCMLVAPWNSLYDRPAVVWGSINVKAGTCKEVQLSARTFYVNTQHYVSYIHQQQHS
jgi:hypothetical protein